MTTSKYNLPPADYGPTPRRVKWTRGTPIRVIVYLLIALIASAGIAGYYGGYSLTRSLYQHGSVTSASIIDKHYTQGRSRTSYFDVFFMVNLKSYSEELEVSDYDYDLYPQDKPVTITYLPSDPSQLTLGTVTAAGFESSRQGLTDMVIVTLLIAVLLLGLLERSLWKEYRLLENGVIVDAVVESVEGYTIKGTSYVRIRYRFGVDGGTVVGIYSQQGTVDVGPPIGSTTRVIASPANPSVNKPISQIAFVGLA